ncbi:nucleotide exchange factor GrpE [Glaciecola petra]|uniref:Protein GrpE n=1 Tax=Glaciecola petra TaxID=3075602 RepID=A0ABU2ZMW6_9ALTE|nr:nucleotide exchange factor GrpE [Aestuariibacter sp. P117]MDT0593973.1 nucleotide exchange factor GrpE [Aestuariibacter sp. P117]
MNTENAGNRDGQNIQAESSENSATNENDSNQEYVTSENSDSQVKEDASENIDATQNYDEQEIDWKAYADELETKLSAAEAKVDEQKDSVLRAIAEGENARRRAEQEIDKARKFALEKFAKELLNVVDNLERATLAADAENEAIKPLLEGIELTQKSFITTFENAGLKIIDPQGESFNPEQHQAMSMQETDEVPPNTVIAVMQKGYLLNERLLRPAMVMVSRGSTNTVDTKA